MNLVQFQTTQVFILFCVDTNILIYSDDRDLNYIIIDIF